MCCLLRSQMRYMYMYICMSYSYLPQSSVKRPRHDHSSHTYTPSVSMDTVVVSPASHRAPPAGPSYPPLPPTLTSHQQLTYTPSHSPHDIPSHPHTLTTSHLPTSHLTAPPHHASPSHKQLLSEDWVHVDMVSPGHREHFLIHVRELLEHCEISVIGPMHAFF